MRGLPEILPTASLSDFANVVSLRQREGMAGNLVTIDYDTPPDLRQGCRKPEGCMASLIMEAVERDESFVPCQQGQQRSVPGACPAAAFFAEN